MTSRRVIQRLQADGWYLDRVVGSHHQFKHPAKPGTVTVKHPVKDVTIANLKSMERQAGIKLRPGG